MIKRYPGAPSDSDFGHLCLPQAHPPAALPAFEVSLLSRCVAGLRKREVTPTTAQPSSHVAFANVLLCYRRRSMRLLHCILLKRHALSGLCVSLRLAAYRLSTCTHGLTFSVAFYRNRTSQPSPNSVHKKLCIVFSLSPALSSSQTRGDLKQLFGVAKSTTRHLSRGYQYSDIAKARRPS